MTSRHWCILGLGALLAAHVTAAPAVSHITREIVARSGGVTPFMWQFWAFFGIVIGLTAAIVVALGFALRAFK